MPNVRALKFFRKDCTLFSRRTTRPGYMYVGTTSGHYHDSSGYFDYSKNSLTKIKPHKKILVKFPNQKNPGIENFKSQKILRSSPSIEIRSTPWGYQQRWKFMPFISMQKKRSIKTTGNFINLLTILIPVYTRCVRQETTTKLCTFPKDI